MSLTVNATRTTILGTRHGTCLARPVGNSSHHPHRTTHLANTIKFDHIDPTRLEGLFQKTSLGADERKMVKRVLVDGDSVAKVGRDFGVRKEDVLSHIEQVRQVDSKKLAPEPKGTLKRIDAATLDALFEKTEFTDGAREIVKMVLIDGESFVNTGKTFGVTKQRVFNLVNEIRRLFDFDRGGDIDTRVTVELDLPESLARDLQKFSAEFWNSAKHPQRKEAALTIERACKRGLKMLQG